MHSWYTLNSIETRLDDKQYKKLAHQLSQVLQEHNSSVSAFLCGNTLAAFANKMCEAGIITTELRDDPVYNTIERQFTAQLSISDTEDNFETLCTDLLDALKSQGNALKPVADRIKRKWIEVGTNLNIDLNF